MTPTPGEALRLHRQRAGMRVSDVARALDISEGTVHNIEHARGVPSVATVARLCHLYGVPDTELAGIVAAYGGQ